MKKIFRWLILGGTLFFLLKAFKDNWLGVSAIRINITGWLILGTATSVTLLAHIWAGWIWTWALKELNQSVSSIEFIQVYLKTNIAKYLPGNVWHYYGRIIAAKNANIPTNIATLSVLLEPLLMLAAALIIILLFASQIVVNNWKINLVILQLLGLIIILGILHPWFLNPTIQLLDRWKNKKSQPENQLIDSFIINRYPVKPLLGEIVFLGLRASGFILTMLAINSLTWQQIPLLFGTFSCAWVMGLIVPGAPGGLGVFETIAILLLQYHFPAALVISAIALYRLISILAETTGAAIAWLHQRINHKKIPS
ncbi:lysylphosphatidylglycerol synthase domain-containing protein [Dolichospermum circinale CS-534/05]|uniref:lysylphosphatidylglycerol synthase domain-containing protein n=1 Tax=Dolichospermum circinale TaxID=109265 RepID=UPI002330B35D|nr:lysylphosphatidylglycerol synthase domain-containing protein [Dolichospermum circinale]MDB9454085.1 lysylphosphatidylglycerol synthase domain-containing protein [Dolichospermum circinale CS-541/06]MDB9460987.1 lysylphosphatidylglycerol synthase domain-containing protein [Dolichospermum circinale CS-541/04]MDB9492580.1 lysylphosphatidylglycerol synthase domain-containing protein [Dolichospermum circinale CS-534/05]MDB9545835.1 lysylphosphatidylglycerol synthase domain-containing protein [Doli